MKQEFHGLYRWVILALIFVATTLNYLDRIVLSVLIPEIKTALKVTDIHFGYILTAFQVTYTLGFLGAGKVVDWLGTKLGYLLAMVFWSIAAGMHALCGSAWCLATWRGVLGLAESGNFPAAIKAVSEWFSIKDRAFATALFNSGTSISNIIGPPIIAAITLSFGWRWAFLLFGLTGIVFAFIWQFFYKTPVEKPKAPGAKSAVALRWPDLLRYRSTWGIMLGKFLTDPVWWFYLFWMPNYLSSQRGFDLKEIAFAIPMIYILATLMGFVGGWCPGYLMRRGWMVAKARKTTMLVCAAFLPFTALAVFASSPWMAILLVSLACGAHNGWSANIFTMTSDCFPSQTVGSVTGLAGFAGGLGGILFATLAPGYIITYFGYSPIFILMGVMHPIAFLVIAKFVLIKKQEVNNG